MWPCCAPHPTCLQLRNLRNILSAVGNAGAQRRRTLLRPENAQCPDKTVAVPDQVQTQQASSFSALAPVASLLISVAILLLGNGLQGTLLPVRAQLEDFSSLDIGILGSAYFLGFAGGCLLGPHAIRRAGHIRAFAAMVSIASTLSLLHALIVAPEFWWVFRAMTGFCFAGLYMIIESWLMEKSTNANRGFVFSVYTVINLTVITVGQMMLATDNPLNFQLFALSSILVSIAAVPIAMTRAVAPEPPKVVRIRPLHLMQISPVGVVGCFAVGLANGSFWSLGPVFAQRQEGDVTAIAVFMSLTVIAGAVGQWPIGRASDRFDRRYIIIFASLAAAAAGAALTVSARFWAPDLMVFAFAVLFGLFAFPLYSLCAAHTNDHVEAGGFVEAASGLLLVFSLGAVIGPVAASTVMQLYGVASLFGYTAMVHLALALYVLYRIRRRTAPAAEDRGTFAENDHSFTDHFNDRHPFGGPPRSASGRDETGLIAEDGAPSIATQSRRIHRSHILREDAQY